MGFPQVRAVAVPVLQALHPEALEERHPSQPRQDALLHKDSRRYVVRSYVYSCAL